MPRLSRAFGFRLLTSQVERECVNPREAATLPVSGRQMALADVYDALVSRRVHKEAMTRGQATSIIQQTRGRHFDPDVVDAFLAAEDKFKAIAVAYADTQADLRKKVDYLGIAQV